MKTTAMLIEILIVGVTFILIAIPFLALALDVSPLVIFARFEAIPIYYRAIMCYALGIIWNRVCNMACCFVDKRVVGSVFASRSEYQAARIRAVNMGQSVADYLDGFRSLIRISRATAVLLLVYLVTLPFVMRVFDILDILCLHQIVTLEITLLLLFVAASYVWFRLRKGYLIATREAVSLVR